MVQKLTMVPQLRKHISDDGVERGYYVYLHKDKETGHVFYVGKGSGRRAWETGRRSNAWKEKVASLTNGWEAEILAKDLSELEALGLEEDAIEKYGGDAWSGGTLTNRTPGGEHPLSVGIGFRLTEEGARWQAAYHQARKFVSLPRVEQEAIVKALNRAIAPVMSQLEALRDEAENSGDEEFGDRVMDVEGMVEDIRTTSSDFLRRRISWKSLGIDLEEDLENFESELEDEAQQCGRLRGTLIASHRIVDTVFRRIDSGNREEAEESANREVGWD